MKERDGRRWGPPGQLSSVDCAVELRPAQCLSPRGAHETVVSRATHRT
jgi:hypothetical protein